MRRFVALILLTAALTPMSSPAWAGPIGVDYVSDFLIDAPHAHVFTSGNTYRGEGQVSVSDLDTSLVAQLPIDTPWAMTLSADGTQVLVAQGESHSIASIDATTLGVTTIPLGSSSCPEDLAVVDGELWMVSKCWSIPELAVVDLATASVTPVSTDLTFENQDWILLASPQKPATIFVIDSGDSSEIVSSLDVAVTPPAGGSGTGTYSATVHDQITVTPGPAEDATLSPDGSVLALVRGYESIDRYSTADLSLVGRRQLGGYYNPSSVALRDDGWRVETYYLNLVGRAQLIRPDESVARTWQLDKGASRDNYFGRVGFAGDTVMALQARQSDWTLHVLPLKLESTLTLTSRRFVGYRKPFVLSVKRTGTSARNVEITATPYGKPERVVGHVHLDAKGRGELTVTASRNTTYAASVAGDATYLPASATRRVQVPGAVEFHVAGKHPVKGGYLQFPTKATATLVAKIPHSKVGSCAYIGIQYKSSGQWRALAGTDCIELPKSRIVWAKFRAADFLGGVRHPLRMYGRWWGDALFGRARSRYVYARFG